MSNPPAPPAPPGPLGVSYRKALHAPSSQRHDQHLPSPLANSHSSNTGGGPSPHGSLVGLSDYDDVKVDFTPVDLTKFTAAFDSVYVFNYFDRTGSGAISIKDLTLVLNVLGINPALPATQATLKKLTGGAATDKITLEVYQKLLQELPRPKMDRETVSQSVKIIAEFFGRDPAKGVVSVEQAQRVMLSGENKLTTAQMNQVSTLAATSGAERAGQINMNTLVALV